MNRVAKMKKAIEVKPRDKYRIWLRYAVGRKATLKEVRIADLFATHPPISKRIELLKGMAYQYTGHGH